MGGEKGLTLLFSGPNQPFLFKPSQMSKCDLGIETQSGADIVERARSAFQH